MFTDKIRWSVPFPAAPSVIDMLRPVDTFCILTLAVFSAPLFLVGCDTTV